MSTSSITELLPPTVDTSDQDGALVTTLSGSWRNLYNGSEEFVNMDCCWDTRNAGGAYVQEFSHHGESEMESDTVKMPRSVFFPLSGRIMNGLRYRVRGVYEGPARYTDFWMSPAIRVSAPPQPKIEIEPVSDGSDYEVTVIVESGTHGDPATVSEQYDIVLVARWATSSGQQRTETRISDALADSLTETFDISAIESGLGHDDYIEFTAEAYARGIGGTSVVASASHVFAQPPKPAIDGISVEGDLVCVRITTNRSSHHPVESTSIERTTSSARSARELSDMSGVSWTEVGKVDGGDCAGLTDNVTDAMPAAGMRTYYRVKVTAGKYSRYSTPVDMGIYQPLPEYVPGCAFVFGATSGDDGESALIDVAWKSDSVINGVTDADMNAYKGTTRLSWSDFEHAWQSTEKPSECDFDWKDSPARPVPDMGQGTGYVNTGSIWITGLDEGVPVYVRARRVMKGSGDEKLGELSNEMRVVPVSTPEWAILKAPAFALRGCPISLSWTFEGEREQTAWAVILDEPRMVVAGGNDASGHCVVHDVAFDSMDSVSLYVIMTTGGGWVASDVVTVRIVDVPTLEVLCLSRITSMPFAVIAGASGGAGVALSVTSRGIVYETPIGMAEQYAGDVVWSGEGTGHVVVEDARLVNGCTYDVTARATDADTGLCSMADPLTFTVDWAHRAPLPIASVTVDDDGLSANIAILEPQGALDTDTCEIYRQTPDGNVLIASGISFGSTVKDRFAPFSYANAPVGTAYRVACRTLEGDAMWVDVEYELFASDMVIDFGQRRLLLPYDIEDADDFKKRFERHHHMDGSTHGAWDSGVDRDASISTKVMRLAEAEQRRLVRDLAHHDGPAFVRLPNGVAFEANVDVHMSESPESGVMSVALDCEEFDLTDDFMPTARDIDGGGNVD